MRDPDFTLSAGPVAATPWDSELAREMNRAQIAVHEEALLDVLLADLRDF